MLSLACTTGRIELKYCGWLSPSAKQHQNPYSGPPPEYWDLSIHNDWPVKIATVDLPVGLKGKLKCISFNSLILSGAQNMDIGTTSQMLLMRLDYVYQTG